MGFMDIFKKKDTNTTLSKDELREDLNAVIKEDTINRINLSKEKVHSICLTKPSLTNLRSRVGLVLDYSGSMYDLYNNGTIQGVIDMILPIAMEFDDNGSMEVWIFSNDYHRLPDVTLDNVYNYVQREILGKYSMGGTYFAPVMRDVIDEYSRSSMTDPAYVLFITDGENSDASKAENLIKDSSKLPIFWQFVGVGYEQFQFLSKLDDMSGRYVDNADFFKVSKMEDITYDKLLDEYPGWVSNPKVKEMLT